MATLPFRSAALCILIRRALAALLLAASTTSALALFVASDTRFGANTLVRDTDTGIGWLRLDITRGLSFDAVASQLGAGGRFEGFATVGQREIRTLFLNAGARQESEYPPGYVFSAGELARVSSFLDLIGAIPSGPTVRVASGKLAAGVTAFDTYRAGLYLGPDYTGYYDDNVFFYRDIGHADTGVWLITSPVPEPGTVALMLAGLAVVALARRRMR